MHDHCVHWFPTVVFERCVLILSSSLEECMIIIVFGSVWLFISHLAFNSLFTKLIFVLLSFTLSPIITLLESSWLTCCIFASKWWRIESPIKAMVVCIIERWIEWTLLYLKHMSGNDLHIPKVRFYLPSLYIILKWGERLCVNVINVD